MKNKTLKAVGAAALFAIAGCESFEPDKDLTDLHAQDLLAKTENPELLINRYHVMVNKHTGKDLGVLFIHSVQNDPNTGKKCASYNAFTSSRATKTTDWFRSSESMTHTTCLDFGNE